MCIRDSHRRDMSMERPWMNFNLFTNSPCQRLWRRHICDFFFWAGRFSYGESPWTPPLEGTSLHRRIESVERPWGILSLFTIRLRVNSPCLRLWHRHVATPFWNRSFFLRWITADPSPWGKFTPPTKQECGETPGDLEPVYDLFMVTCGLTLLEAVTNVAHVWSKQNVWCKG